MTRLVGSNLATIIRLVESKLAIMTERSESNNCHLARFQR